MLFHEKTRKAANIGIIAVAGQNQNIGLLYKGKNVLRNRLNPVGQMALLNTGTGHLCAPRELEAPPPAYSDVPAGYTVLPPADALPVCGSEK